MHCFFVLLKKRENGVVFAFFLSFFFLSKICICILQLHEGLLGDVACFCLYEGNCGYIEVKTARD